MNLALFGPTGGTGLSLAQQALDLSHSLTVLARNPEKLADLEHEKLTIIKGDVLNYEDVKRTVSNQDAVLCCLGTRAYDKHMLRADGTANIIKAMEEKGVKRLICQTSLGYGDTAAVMPWYMTYLIIPIILKNAFKDHQLQEQHIEDSDLDWTIVRPGSLTNGPKTEGYRYGFSPDTKTKLRVSRADVAHLMLRLIEWENGYIRTKVGISY